MTLDINPRTCRHKTFFENNDIPQVGYENARKAAFGKRHLDLGFVQDSIKKHGVAGLFINPESSLISMPPRTSPRLGTALYRAHLPEGNFGSIALSLAECVGVSSTSRIQKVNKKTVLLALAKAGVHAKKSSGTSLRHAKQTYTGQ